MNARHDLVQALVYLFCRPCHAHRVLCHLQARSGHTTSVDRLAGSKQLLGIDKLVDSLCRAAHVADLGNAQRLLGQYLVGIFAVQFVLRGTRQIDVGLLFPRFLASKERRTREFVCIGLADVVARSAQFQQVVNLLVVQTSRVVDVSVRT